MPSQFKQEQYDILKRCSANGNMSEWNSYRAERTRTAIHLDGADLRQARLEGAQLGGCSLRGACFARADLLAADLRGADLTKANFKGANLWGATLSKANLQGACLAFANLENADLRKAKLEQADLSKANLEGAITQSAGEEDRSEASDNQEVIIYLAQDLTYREVVSVTKSMESLSLIAGASTPQLNEIQISLRIDNSSIWEGTETENLISVSIPRNVAEILPDLFPIKVAFACAAPHGSAIDSKIRSEDTSSPAHFRDFLAHAGFSEHEQRIAAKNLDIHRIEERSLMRDLGLVTGLVKSERIRFRL